MSMESRVLRTVATLGVPGVALGVFYLLLRGFGFDFAQIDRVWAAAIAIIFLVLAAGITAFALHLWRPNRSDFDSKPASDSTSDHAISDDDKARLTVLDIAFAPLANRYRVCRNDQKQSVVTHALNEFSGLQKKWRMSRRVFEFYITNCLEEGRIIHIHEFVDSKRMVEFVKRHRAYANDVGAWLAANVAGVDLSDS